MALGDMELSIEYVEAPKETTPKGNAPIRGLKGKLCEDRREFKALAGEISCGFTWSATPQGGAYWRDVVEVLRHIDTAMPTVWPQARNSESRQAHKDNAKKIAQKLTVLFEWKTSPQGQAYWEQVYVELQRI